MGWHASWTWYPTTVLVLVFTPLLFPTGRLVSPRWRPAAWLAGAATAAFTVLAALQPTLGGLAHDRVVPNPIGVAGLENPENSTIGTVLLGLVVVSMVAAVVSLAIRSAGRGAMSASTSSGSPMRARCCRWSPWPTSYLTRSATFSLRP